MSESEKRERGRRLRELRLALGYATQEALAEASKDGRLVRTYVNRAENGGNALTSLPLQRDFADALHLRVEDFADYLDGKMPLEELVRRRNAIVHGVGGSFDPDAVIIVSMVNELPGLRSWIEKNPKKLRVSELVRGLEIYRQTPPRSRSDGQPLNGWGSFFDDALAGRLTTHTRGDQDAAEALELEQLPSATRRGLQNARKKR